MEQLTKTMNGKSPTKDKGKTEEKKAPVKRKLTIGYEDPFAEIFLTED